MQIRENGQKIDFSAKFLPKFEVLVSKNGTTFRNDI